MVIGILVAHRHVGYDVVFVSDKITNYHTVMLLGGHLLKAIICSIHFVQQVVMVRLTIFIT